MAILVDENTRSSARASPAARAPSTPNRPSPTAPRWSAASPPARAATSHLGLPVFNSVARGEAATGANATVDLRAAALRRRRDPRGDRRRDRADRLHHRGHPGARHDEGQARARGLEVAPDRAELPRRHHAGRLQDRHHARPHPQARLGRRCLALGHADLRGGQADHRRRASASPPAVGIGGDPIKGTEHIDVLECSSPTPRPSRSS